MIKHWIITSLTLLLVTACASSTGIYKVKSSQSICEQQSEQFLEIFECTKDQVAAIQAKPEVDKSLTQSAELYLLKGEQLKEKVLNKDMTNLDAKFEWQKLYVELDENIREFQQRAAIRSRVGIGFGAGYRCMWPYRMGCWW